MGLRQQECVRLHAGIRQSSPPQVPTRRNKKKQDAPHYWNQTMYGEKTKYTDTETAELVDAHYKLCIQKVCETFLYYAISE